MPHAVSRLTHRKSSTSTIAPVLWTVLITMAGCAGGGLLSHLPSGPFGSNRSDVVPGVPSPAERMAELHELAKEGPSMSAERQAQVCRQLIQTFSNEDDPLIRLELARTLGAFPCTEAAQGLQAALLDPDPDVRVVACEVLAERGGPQVVQALSEVLQSDTDADVRLAAARALGQTDDRQAVDALATALEDRDPAIQLRAAKSLNEVTDQDFGTDVGRWQQYVRGEMPPPREPVSIVERIRQMF